jgi:hypothetical protein
MKPEKKAVRNEKNKAAKVAKAAARQANLALIGQLVYEKEVPTGKVSVVSTFAEDGTETKTTTPEMKTTLCLPPAIRTAKDGSILPLKQREPRSVPALAFIGAKTYKHHGAQSKLRPGNKELHGEAIVELHSRSLAVEIDKALNPPEAEGTPIPVVPADLAGEAAQL